MNRFNFFSRQGGNSLPTTSNSPAHYDAATADPYDDRAPLSPRTRLGSNSDSEPDDNILPDDLEAQPTAATREMQQSEMAERRTPATRFLHRFRPAIPSFFSTARTSAFFSSHQQQQQQQPHQQEGYEYGYGGYGYPRPTSSAYSGEGLRGAPGTVINGNGNGHGYGGLDMGMDDGGPKSPEYRIGADELNLPSTRLHLPELERTWTQGSNGPPTRPGTGVAVPEAAVVREGRHGSRSSRSTRPRQEEGSSRSDGHHRERRRRRRGGTGERSGSGGSRRSGRSGSHRSRSNRSRDEEGRSERRERRRRREGEHGSRTRERRPPKHFLFCFPWIKSRRIRSQILRCFVSGMFLVLTLAIYLTLSLTKNINSHEFTILLILIILAVTIFFCHSLIRLCMMVVKARKRERMVQQGQLPEMVGPGGYAIPREPIPVVLARDEEAAGIESEATKTGPPAYGVWRESVRVDPNRLFWVRNERAAPAEVSDISSSSESGSTPSSRSRTTVPRPPSYSSDDGVSYVVEARPRSIAPPRGNAPAGGSHPSESVSSGSWV